MTREFKTVLYAEEQGIATITLNRPDKRNAITYELLQDVKSALDDVRAAKKGRAVLDSLQKAEDLLASRITTTPPTAISKR